MSEYLIKIWLKRLNNKDNWHIQRLKILDFAKGIANCLFIAKLYIAHLFFFYGG